MIAPCDPRCMTTAKNGDLEIQIEELVRAHMAALRRAASAAVERAFGQALSRPVKGGRVLPSGKGVGRRRSAEEMTALAERLYAAICAHPGAAMVKLASEVDATPRALNRPAQQLRRAGRVRTVGQRHATRYFPMSGKASARA